MPEPVRPNRPGQHGPRRQFVVAVVIAVLVALTGCGGSDDGADEGSAPSRTLAFLRAVAGSSSSEPYILEELQEAGYVPGRNLEVLAADPAEAYPDPAEAAEAVRGWVSRGVDLVVALSSSGAAAAARAAPDLPILFLSNDPTATGLVNDEQRPEGNLTGATFRAPPDRTLALARRAIPGLQRVGLAYPPADPAAVANRDAVAGAAGGLGMELVLREFTTPDQVGPAVEQLAREGIQALLVSTSPVATRAIAETQAAAKARRLPVIANSHLATSAVVAIYPDAEELGRQLGRQAYRLLSGSDPGSVPVEDPRRFHVRVNLREAAALGLTVPDDVFREADEVIR